MSRPKTDWQTIFDTDADLLAYCQRRRRVSPALDEFAAFLDNYECVPDPAFPEHRRHLNNAAIRWLERLLSWRFGYKTFNQPMPGLRYWRDLLHFGERHQLAMLWFLVRQGLISIWYGSLKRGVGCFHISIDPLLDKIRAHFAAKREEDKARDTAWQDHQRAEESAAEQQPLPLPVPTPEPEPEPLPAAALVRASEWDTALEQLRPKVSRSAYVGWLAQIRGWKAGDAFILQCPNTYGVKIVKQRWGELILHILTPLLAPSMEIFITADLPARSSA